MKPYTVCYMMSSLDGRIDCAMTEYLKGTDLYYDILKEYSFDAFISGAVTASMHYAKGKTEFHGTKITAPEVYRACEAGPYTVILDTRGCLAWESSLIDQTHLIVAVSEEVTREYLDDLKDKKISYVACGCGKIDLGHLLDVLYDEFGVKRCGVVGGGLINGAFLEAGLLDEIGMLVGPGIDGRSEMRASFDGLTHQDEPYQLHLESCRVYPCEAVMLKYTIRK